MRTVATRGGGGAGLFVSAAMVLLVAGPEIRITATPLRPGAVDSANTVSSPSCPANPCVPRPIKAPGRSDQQRWPRPAIPCAVQTAAARARLGVARVCDTCNQPAGATCSASRRGSDHDVRFNVDARIHTIAIPCGRLITRQGVPW
ncbi:MAG: hypothetical protein ACPIOQ_01945 [Promethearchaeia archaeon]